MWRGHSCPRLLILICVARTLLSAAFDRDLCVAIFLSASGKTPQITQGKVPSPAQRSEAQQAKTL